MKEYIINKIVSIPTHEECESVWIELRKEIKFFGLVFRHSGIYSTITDTRISDVTELDTKAYKYHEGKIIEKAHIILTFTNSEQMTTYYNSYHEALKSKRAFADVHSLKMIR